MEGSRVTRTALTDSLCCLKGLEKYWKMKKSSYNTPAYPYVIFSSGESPFPPISTVRTVGCLPNLLSVIRKWFLNLNDFECPKLKKDSWDAGLNYQFFFVVVVIQTYKQEPEHIDSVSHDTVWFKSHLWFQTHSKIKMIAVPKMTTGGRVLIV